MNKPTVFISHSSRDEAIARGLSEALRRKTGGAVEIFVSSDGQSIPLGRNWVHSVEEALDRASLMFVLLSPNSIDSQWIYFEAGYSYSQKRRVIPLGILNIDLGVLSAPMSLLQGFNVTSAESLSNLVILINKEFDHSHIATFTQAEYDAIFGHAVPRSDPLLQEFVSWIDDIQIGVRVRFDFLKSHIERVLTSSKIPFRTGNFDVVSPGACYRRPLYDPHNTPLEERPLELDLDPLLARTNLACFQKIIASYAAENQIETPPEVNLQIFFAPWVNYVKAIHRLTAKLPGSGIQFGKHHDFTYQGRSFYLSRGDEYNRPDSDHEERVQLSLYLPADQLLRYDLIGLLRTLFHHSIIFTDA